MISNFGTNYYIHQRVQKYRVFVEYEGLADVKINCELLRAEMSEA
jgi:hypothetical protein